MSIRRVSRLFVTTLVLFLAACSEPPPPAADTGLTEEAVAANNRGVALMGQFQYGLASTVFQELAAAYPDEPLFQINLAIAILNRQLDGDEAQAMHTLEQVLTRDPSQIKARYCAGLLRLRGGDLAGATTDLQTVAQADPQDGYAAYFLGQALAQQGDEAQALHWFERAIILDPYLRSAYYAIYQTARKQRRTEQAKAALEDYIKLEPNPKSHLAEFKYTRMGTKCEASVVNLSPAPSAMPPQGPLFADGQALDVKTGPDSTVTTADLNNDGLLDLFITHVADGPAPNRLLLGTGNGEFTPLTEHPLNQVTEVRAALWGDWDDDGRVDVYLCRRGANQLWHQDEDGNWTDVTAATGSSDGDYDTVDGLWLDADHDGDLDLFLVNADGPNELLNNDRDGGFRPIAATQGIGGDGGPSRRVLATDLDRDRDVDLVIINQRPPHEVYINDRLWQYRPAAGFDAFRASPIVTAVAEDWDADGQPELYALDDAGAVSRWAPDEAGIWQAQTLATGAVGSALALSDGEGDGKLDVLYATADGWNLADLTATTANPRFHAPASGVSALLPVYQDPGRGPAVAAISDGGLRLWRPGPGRYAYLNLRFSGKSDDAHSMRSNAAGIGTYFSVRTDSRWTRGHTFRHSGGPGQSLQPYGVGLGDAPQADFVSMEWSDGVLQSEAALTSGATHPITETQRQLSSCPVLFAWDGEKFAFVSDLLGVGGLGYAVGPGEYAEPRPHENFLLPPGLLQSRDGVFALKLSEPMEEVMYLDAARLVAYDLPPGWDMVLDERMGILGAEPTGEAFFFRREIPPRQATVAGMGDVTAAVTARDLKAAPVGALDQRFIGRLADEQVLTLEFENPLPAGQDDLVLVADGWLEYPYSQTMFAAWQAGADFRAPTLEARDGTGNWYLVAEQFGYPAGMPRRMGFPLPPLKPGTDALRLRTNQQIYWDRLAVAVKEPAPDVRRHGLRLLRAAAQETGFAARSTGDQFRPHYDYQRRVPLWDVRYPAGAYSELGPVTALIARQDGAVTVTGPGEEVHVEFADDLPTTPAGWTRRFVLESYGWVKDMDLYTKDGDTVEPLPVLGTPDKDRETLHRRYNTRFVAGG